MTINDKEREVIWNKLMELIVPMDNTESLELISQTLATLVIIAFKDSDKPLDINVMTAFVADIMPEMFRGQLEMPHNMTEN